MTSFLSTLQEIYNSWWYSHEGSGTVTSSNKSQGCADDKDEEGEDKGEGNDQDTDIFEMEGQREELQLDPSKFDCQENGGSKEEGQREGNEAGNRVTGRSGFEGKVTEEAPSTSGREQVNSCSSCLDLWSRKTCWHAPDVHAGLLVHMACQGMSKKAYAA